MKIPTGCRQKNTHLYRHLEAPLRRLTHFQTASRRLLTTEGMKEAPRAAGHILSFTDKRGTVCWELNLGSFFLSVDGHSKLIHHLVCKEGLGPGGSHHFSGILISLWKFCRGNSTGTVQVQCPLVGTVRPYGWEDVKCSFLVTTPIGTQGPSFPSF